MQDIRITDQRKPDFTATVEEAVQNGYPLIIEKVEEHLNPVLVPILLRNITNNGKKV